MTDLAEERERLTDEVLDLLRFERRGDMWVGHTPDWYGPVVFGGVGLLLTIGAVCRDAPEGSRLQPVEG